MSGLPKRKSLRRQNYDYSTPGYYFITICTFRKEHILGNITGASPVLSIAGKIVMQSLNSLSYFFESVSVDPSIAMPNHLHFIMRLHDGNKSDLTQIIRNFKSVSSRKIKALTKIHKVWQRSFYDRIIRTERELNLVRLYIDLNPLMWEKNQELSDMEFKSEEDLVKLLEKYRVL